MRSSWIFFMQFIKHAYLTSYVFISVGTFWIENIVKFRYTSNVTQAQQKKNCVKEVNILTFLEYPCAWSWNLSLSNDYFYKKNYKMKLFKMVFNCKEYLIFKKTSI